MNFHEMLLAAIESADIPLRFEPGAGESVAKPVTEMLREWISAHMPKDSGSEFDAGWAALAAQLLGELDGS
jgi:hypothetical protein